MTEEHGGPAFPSTIGPFSEDVIGFNGEKIPSASSSFYGGMNLRDYFAAQAMAIVAIKHNGDLCTSENTAAKAYRLADAMLKERAK